MIRKAIVILIVFCLLFEQTGFAQVAGELDLSGYFSNLVQGFVQEKFRPIHLRYLAYDTLNNSFKLLLDKGDLLKTQKSKLKSQNLTNQELKENTKTLLDYFFIGLALPNESFWVNLRPEAEGTVPRFGTVPDPQGIIDPFLERTDIGRILLEADVQLKKDTARFTSPETPEGRKYWDRLYKKAEELFGSETITIPTLTRPWIVPNEIIIRETADSAYIYKASLKVLLEEDYFSPTKSLRGAEGDEAISGIASSVASLLPRNDTFSDSRLKALNHYSSELIEELIIPKLTKRINSAKDYAPLRQVYYSLILAQWFKARLGSRLPVTSEQLPVKANPYLRFIDSKNLINLTSKIPWTKTTYFREYQKSFQEGEYNLKEQVSTPYGQVIRSYTSGGIKLDTNSVIASGSIPSQRSLPQFNYTQTMTVTGAPLEMKVVIGEQGMQRKIPKSSSSLGLSGKERMARKFLASKINMDRLEQEFAEIIQLYGYIPFQELYIVAGDSLLEEIFLLKQGFGEELKIYWPDFVALGVSTSRKEAMSYLFRCLPGVEHLFGEKFNTYWPGLFKLGKAAGEFAGNLFSQLVSFKRNFLSEEEFDACWPNFVELGVSAGENVVNLFSFDVLFEIKLLCGEEFGIYWPIFIELGLAADGGKDVMELFRRDIPILIKTFTLEELKGYRSELVTLMNKAKKYIHLFFQYSLPALKPLIHSRQDLNKIGEDLIKIFQLCEGVETDTAKAIHDISRLIQKYPSSWNAFIKPIIYNQTQGAFLCLQGINELDNLGAIESEEDLTFLKKLIEGQGIRAWDLLENFLVLGVKDEIISKPIAQEEDVIKNFLAKIQYPIIDIYKVYKNKPSQVEELKQRCKDIHMQLRKGDASGVENDPLFGAMLYYVFPAAITTQRKQYLNIYKQRPDRAHDTQSIPAKLQNQELLVSTGRYTLKDPSKPLDETPWSTLLEVVREVNPQAEVSLSQEEIVELGARLLENWQTGNLYPNRKSLFRELYRYFRQSRGQSLPNSLGSINNIMVFKQFISDTLRDLVSECINGYKEKNSVTYQSILNKMFKTNLENPQGTANAILNIRNRFKDEPEQSKDKIAGVLKIEDPEVIESIWEKIKDKQTKIELVEVLEGISFQVQEGKEAVVIAHRLQGNEYHAMQSEVSQKYEFRASQKEIVLRALVSKRKAHGVVGLNMGVCTAPDAKLWDNPNFMNVILWDEDNASQGGMHVFIIEDAGKRYLTLPGINPSVGLLSKVNSEDIYNKLIAYAKDLAKGLHCEAVLIPKNATIHSNRSEIQRVIAVKNYPTLTLSKIHPFSYSPEYSFQDCFLAAKVTETPEINKPNTAASSALVPQTSNTVGGIDFTSLPIVTQAIANLKIDITNSQVLNSLRNVNLNQEWQGIERLASSGIIPSAERFKTYIQAASVQQGLGNVADMDKVLLCIADILRQQEENALSTDPLLRDILVVLEAVGDEGEIGSVLGEVGV